MNAQRLLLAIILLLCIIIINCRPASKQKHHRHHKHKHQHDNSEQDRTRAVKEKFSSDPLIRFGRSVNAEHMSGITEVQKSEKFKILRRMVSQSTQDM